MTDIYDDGTVVCGPDRLEIHSYYFPAGTKNIPYTQIKGLQRIEIEGVASHGRDANGSVGDEAEGLLGGAGRELRPGRS